MKRLWITSALTIFFLTSCGSTPSVVKKYTITWNNWDGTTLATSEVEENHKPVYEGATPTRPSTENYDYVYAGWDKEIVKATEDTTYTATYDHNFLYGSYPQTLANPTIVGAIDPDTGYYSDAQGNKYFKFKALNDYTTDNNVKVKKGDENYYLVKPIEWKILSEADGKGFYTTYKLLMTHQYNSIEASNEEPIYNYYDESSIHSWINGSTAPSAKTEIGNFYWRAFCINQITIASVEVINNQASTCDEKNRFFCDPTNDSIFSLSRLELRGDKQEHYGFPNSDLADKSRLALTTDFARANGAAINKNYGMYWTRSPSDNDWSIYGTDAYVVMTDGHIIQHNITEGNYCVRPAIKIPLIK
ncbi:MAG: DUF6273 domain-containing protein [Bacilli bacterium]|nr:DUF6273 domain-containing protein [Bacilli bacterium]